MPYSINLPDGSTVDNIPDELDPKEAARRIAAAHPQLMGMLAPNARKSGFIPAVKAGWENLKGDIAGLAGRSGLMSIKDAEAQQARNKAEAEKVFTPTKEGWLDSPWLKFKETLGGSAPYMAAPLAAGAAGAVAGPLVAAGAAGLTSATQFTGSNLSRQQQEGKALADTDLQSAALAAVPQAALDMVGFKMIPGIRKIFAAAGKELTPQAAAEIAKAGLKSTLADYAKAGVKASGTEGLTEAGQQVLERLQAGMALNDEAAREEYLQSFIGGAVLGGALSGPGRFQERGREQLQAAKIEEAKQIKAEQDAAAATQQQEEQRVAKLQTPEGAAEVADQYRKAEATYRSMLPPKMAKDADEATKVEHAAQAAEAKNFLKTELQPLIKDYLVAKKTLQAQQPPAAAAAPAPGSVEEEAGLLFPLAKTDLQAPGSALPTADEVEGQRRTLADQYQALDTHLETLRDQVAQAAQAGNTQEALRFAQQFKQAEQARNAAAQQIAELPKAPKSVDLAKQLEKAKTALAKAGELGDVDAIMRAAAKVDKLKSQGAELMQPGPEMEMVPAGGKSESQAEFFPKVATDTLAPKPLQLPFDATKVAVPDRGQGPARLGYDPGTDVRSMEANRMDTSKTAQPDMFNNPEMSTKVQSGMGDVSTKSRAQLMSDLQIARAAGNKAAATEAIEGLRDLKARGEAPAAGADVSSVAGSQLAATMGSRLPGNVAKQQAARDAMHRAYGNFVSVLNRASKGLLKKEELDTARKQVLDNLVDDIGTTRGLPLTAPEAQEVQSQAKQLLNDLQSRFGDTRDVINYGTEKDPDMGPVQERDGTFIRDRIDRPLGTANVESRRPGRQTFANPHAAAMSIKEGLEQIRNDAVNGQPGVPGVVGKQTPKTTSKEALATALETAKTSPLVERLRDNIDAFSADPERRNLAGAWLYEESIGQKNDDGAEVAAELDRLEQGKRSETEGVKTAVQGEMFDDTGILFDTWKEFDDYLASDAVQGVTATMSRLHKQLAPVEKKVAELRKNLEALQAKYAAAKGRQDAGAAQATARIDAAQKKLQELIRDMVVTKMDPLYREAEAAQLELADVEARVVANMAKFASKFSSGEYVAAATETWDKAGADFRAALAEEMANGTDLDYFSAGPVIKTQARKNEALVDLTQALLRDLQFVPESRQVLAFLNKDLALQLELQDAQGRVRQTRQFLEMAPATITKATLASPAGTALRKEISAAQRGDTPTAPVKGKTLSSLASLMKTAQETRGDALRGLSEQIYALRTELDAAVAELDAGMSPTQKRAVDRVNPDRVGEDLQAKANAEQRAENDRLERLADIPGEKVTFTDLSAVADKFAELPEKVARLEAKAKDETLPKTTQAKAKNDAKKFRTRMETLYGLVSDDPETVVAAQVSAQKQLDDVQARIGAKQQAINEDGITDKVRLSRTAELYDLRSELRDLKKFVEGFGQKVKRTPIVRERAETQPAEPGTRLRASRQGPLMKKETVAGNVRTGDLTTVGERTLSPRNPITQSGQKKAPTSKQAQRGAVADTAYETAMLKLGKIEDLKERNDAALAKAEENNDPKLTKYQEFDARLTAALEAQQKVVDATVTGKRKAKAVTDIEVDDVTDTIKDYWNQKDATAAYVPLTEEEQVRKVGAVVKGRASPALRDSTDLSTATTEAVKDGRILEAVDRLISEGSAPEVRAAAAKLKPFLLRTKLRTQKDLVDTKGARAAGMYYHDTNTVVLDIDSLSEETMLHELTHAATMRALSMPDAELTRDQRAAKADLVRLHKAIQKNPTFEGEYGKTDLEEFVAEAYSNPQLQAKLDTIGMPRSLWGRIKDLFARLLGYPPDTTPTSRKAKAAIEKLMSASRPKAGGKALPARSTSYASDDIFAKKKTFSERLQGNAALAIEMGAVDMRAPLAKVLKTGASKLAAQAMYYVRKNDHMMSNTYAVMQHGALGIKVDARGNRVIEAGHSKSVQDVFKAIGKIPGVDEADKMQKAQIYLTANRVANDPKAAQALDLSGAAVAKLQADMTKFQADPATMKALENVRDTYADLNRGMIQFLVDTGAMAKAEAARLLATNSYVPFYRVRADGVAELVFDENRTIRLGDIRTQPYLKELKGGTAKLLPLNEAVTRNVMLLTSLGMRNQTTRNVAYALQEIGRNASTKHKPMQIVPGDGGADAGIMRFKQNGKDYHILVDTEGTAAEGIPADLLARSIEGTHLVVPSLVKGFTWFSDVLRSGVTRNPMYVARQLFRDPFAASFTGGLDRGPLAAVAKSIAAYVHQSTSGPSKTAQDLIRKGLVHSQIFSGGPEDLAKISLQLAGGDQGAINKLFATMDRAAMRADSVTREQVYDDVLARTGSEMEAEVAASEMMDFQKRGSSATVQYAARMIPFFNAQIQGLNVLVKAARGTASMQERLDIQNKFFERAMLLAAGTLVYAAAMEDDDTYKNARPSDRYGNWFVPLSRGDKPEDNVTIKLPIPFEVGILFKALPEAIMDMMRGKFGDQEMKAIRTMLLNQIPGGGVPLPQAVKPVLEVATNHSFFTGRDIEGAGMSKLDPRERYTARTTELAKRLAETIPDGLPDALRLSPVQIEHLTRGFFGSLPLMGAALVNEIFASGTAVDRPDKKLTEMPLIGGSLQDVNGGGPTDALYAKIKAADMAKATIDKMRNEGRPQDALIYMRDIENLATIPKLQEAEKKLQFLAQQEKHIRNSSATSGRKREALDVIANQREKMSQRYLDAVSAVSR